MSALASMGEKMTAMMPETPTGQEPVSETDIRNPVEVNINIERTQGNAIYSLLLEVQNALENFKLDVKQESLREVVERAFNKSLKEYYAQQEAEEQERQEKLRAEGKPATRP